MLIHALCDYYDILAKEGKVLPEGYSSVKIHYLISLTGDGSVDRIIKYQDKVLVPSGKKTKEKEVPKDLRMPKRTEKSGIEANIAEHRALYIFGLNQDKDILTPDDRTSKAKKFLPDLMHLFYTAYLCGYSVLQNKKGASRGQIYKIFIPANC